MLEKYISSSTSSERCAVLKKWIERSKTLSISQVKEFMSLGLPKSEMSLLIQVADSSSSLALEDFITQNIIKWDQDVAVSALRVWHQKTDHKLEHRMRWLANSQYSSQRVRYTILLFADVLNMQAFLTDVCRDEQLKEFSPAYHALVIEQATKNNFQHKILDELAVSYLRGLKSEWYNVEKAHVPAMIYLKKFGMLPSATDGYSESWGWLIKALQQSKTSLPKSKVNCLGQEKHSLSFGGLHKKERARFFEQSTFQTLEDAPAQTDLLRFVQKYFHSAGEQNLKDQKYDHPKGLWGQLDKLIGRGDDDSLKKIAEMARESSQVYIPCFLKAIGQFKGNDQAVLKLLDYIRVEEEYLIKSVICSLSSIGTVRAGGELIAMLQRPNITRDHQLFIASSLKDFDHSNMQKELSSVILDFRAKPETSDDTVEIIETLSRFIISQPNSSGAEVVNITSSDSDQRLTEAYKGFKNLSGEVRRALRTGMFFHQEVQKSDASIDLSPVIDMQYKAIELYLREAFERRCMELVKSGVLQRKLDIIGYARPIPAKMSQFENYMSSLPEINKIPFFSKFKLRKMLRALCQYKPGKRFTLDGLKAFALFFLCFSRSECKYGLSNLFPLGFATDKHLHLFVCELHRFQDFRNRAVHEGLPPDVVQEIDQTWQTTFSALSEVDRLLMIEKHMKQIGQAKGA